MSKADARTRTFRTLRQGALAAALVAAASAGADWLEAGTWDWGRLGVSAGTAAVMAGLAYIERAWIDPRRNL